MHTSPPSSVTFTDLSQIMTDKLSSLLTQIADPSQTLSPPATGSISVTEPPVVSKVEPVEDEPYTIKCICNFSDDDGNTIYCEKCDTWQHIDCFYPDNREEAIREDFAHACADCNPRPLNREKAIERTLRLKNGVVGDAPDKKTKRPPAKTQRKRLKTEPPQGQAPSGEMVKNGSPTEASTNKKPKHRPSQSVSSQAPKRSPSYNKAGPHPPSPATTPPDLPDDFQIHHFSEGFCSLYNNHVVPETQNNSFASLAIPTRMSRWLREPDTMKREVGRTPQEVFQTMPYNIEATKPPLEVQDATRPQNNGTTLRWRFLQSKSSVEKDIPLVELKGEVGFQKDYCAESENLWADLSSPLPFVFFHPALPLYIDTRKEGSMARYVRRSCKPNAQLDTYLSQNEYRFWLVSDRFIMANEQITLPWDFRLERSVSSRWLHLLGLNEDESTDHEPDMDEAEYNAISNWIDRILSEHGGCACDQDNNCAFARFHRQYLYGRYQSRTSQSRKKHRKSRNHTISPTSTGHATNSRAASEGQVDDMMDDAKYDSSHSKSASREQTPQARQGSLDQLGILTEPTDRDKRKVAMVEDSFRRMEQQQPPRKKKRHSDGTTTSKSRSKKEYVTSGTSQYVDAGTSGSKSGSPSSTTESPKLLSNPFKAPTSRPSSKARSRQASGSPRPEYCDMATQTEPVQGAWFSESPETPKPRKRIISLSQRLLATRHRVRTDEARIAKSPTAICLAVNAMEIDSQDSRDATGDHGNGANPFSTQSSDLEMPDTTTELPPAAPIKTESGKAKALDLRVQLPPAPTFDSSAVLSSTTMTPMSAASMLPPSPFGTNGLAASGGVHPSPVKKKLSLSDYTKSRMNKSGGKGAALKSSLSNPGELKLEMSADAQRMEKPGNVSPAETGPTTNGDS